MTTASTLGIYVHVPYCRRVCPYCDFNVHIAKRADWPNLIDAIQAELEARASAFWTRQRAPPSTQRAPPPTASATAGSASATAGMVGSIYVGGGTPSLAPIELLTTTTDTVRRLWAVAGDAEVTVEVDPATLREPGFAAVRREGVTRISLGWQSTHDPLLKLLGRGHTAQDGTEAYRLARAAGYDNVSIDLIFAVPGETMAMLDGDLDAIERLAPEHVSLYALTYHEGTELYRRRQQGRIVPIDEDLEADMMEHIEQRLVAAGYEHYEVSNYALPGRRSRHNQLYWNSDPYLGVGPGAHSFVRAGWARGWRWESVRSPAAYIAAWAHSPARQLGRPTIGDPSVSFVEELTAAQLRSERILLRLRLSDGLDLAELDRVDADPESLAVDAGRGNHNRIEAGLVQSGCGQGRAYDAGYDRTRWEHALEQAEQREWVRREGTRVVPTSTGLMNADALAELLV